MLNLAKIKHTEICHTLIKKRIPKRQSQTVYRNDNSCSTKWRMQLHSLWIVEGILWMNHSAWCWKSVLCVVYARNDFLLSNERQSALSYYNCKNIFRIVENKRLASTDHLEKEFQHKLNHFQNRSKWVCCDTFVQIELNPGERSCINCENICRPLALQDALQKIEQFSIALYQSREQAIFQQVQWRSNWTISLLWLTERVCWAVVIERDETWRIDNQVHILNTIRSQIYWQAANITLLI